MPTVAAPSFSVSGFSIAEFLAGERTKDLFRFSTAGSVDDGKSTLIGRLLYDTQSVYEDQVRSIEGKGTTLPGQIDFALLTDGLRAEREQGITIDVAYRYFSTSRRKFIIADTPGHEQYTRNMATGASTADAAVVLIDARKGVLLQSRRHAFIASLLRVRPVLIAVNKMDLAGYGESAFRGVERDFSAVLERIAAETGHPVEATFVPVSALVGDNVVHRSPAMPWYNGPSLLELLEALPPAVDTRDASFRFPVQRVLRPDAAFRGFAGQIASGTVRPGDRVAVLPSGKAAQVERIVTWDGDLAEAHAPLSVTLMLDREVDVSRGDLIVSEENPARVVKRVKAALVWMDERPLACGRRYWLKHLSHTAPAVVSRVDYRTAIDTLTSEPAETLETNGIGVVSLELLRPMALDLYGENRTTGAFILIDPESNATVAAGMATSWSEAAAGAAEVGVARVTAEERAGRWGHRGAVLELHGPVDRIDLIERIDSIERALFELGAIAVRVEGARPDVGEILAASGAIALVLTPAETENLTARIGERTIELAVGDVDADSAAIRNSIQNSIRNSIQKLLVSAGVMLDSGKAGAR